MAKMDRVAYLENQLSNCLESLDTFSVQLTVVQDFLQKQFGSRFVDYAVSRGVYIDKNPWSRGGGVGGGPGCTTTMEPVQINEYGDEGPGEDPLAFVEIISEEDQQRKEAAGCYYEKEDFAVNNNCKEEEAEEEEDGQYYEEEEVDEEYPFIPAPNPVIVNCVSEKGKSVPSRCIKLPSPPPITPRPPPTRTYTQKPRAPSNFLGRKRAGSSPFSNSSQPKMPLLHPQEALDIEYKCDPSNSNLDFPVLTSDGDGLGIGGIVGVEGGQGGGVQDLKIEYSDDLTEYYDILPDKSVKCKICDKILKAGWHKFGRHYRTHTGEKPFSCYICGESFARKDNMNNHIKSKHEKLKPRGHTIGNNDLVYPELPDFKDEPYYIESDLC